jgi:hypothetical protein
MDTSILSRATGVIVVLAAFFLAGNASAGVVLRVTNDGADSATCGSTAKPCRSISRAIENASDGDIIEVGAGRYGDISGMGTLTGGNKNGVKLDVRTLYDAQGLSNVLRRNVTVAGNVDISDQFGFVFSGPNPSPGCPSFDLCNVPANILFTGNTAINNANGFAVTVNADFGPGKVILQNNVALGAGIGVNVTAGDQAEGGLIFSDAIVQLLSNVATHCSLGFSTLLVSSINGNTASDNSLAGFMVVPDNTTSFTGNSAIGNAGPGLILQFSPDINDDQASDTFQTLRGNNFYGNDRNRPALAIATSAFVGPAQDSPGVFNPGPSAHCGILNVGALAAIVVQGNEHTAPVITVSAPGSYWGSAGGPSPTGAGDAVGGLCDQNHGVTIGKPFATASLSITTAP